MPFSSVKLTQYLQMNEIETHTPRMSVKIRTNFVERNSVILFEPGNKIHAD